MEILRNIEYCKIEARKNNSEFEYHGIVALNIYTLTEFACMCLIGKVSGERSMEVFVFLLQTLTGEDTLKWQIIQIISLGKPSRVCFFSAQCPIVSLIMVVSLRAGLGRRLLALAPDLRAAPCGVRNRKTLKSGHGAPGWFSR